MDLFAPATLGRMTLDNRVVMAPMTRSRALGGVPNALMAEYYAQRAGAGLIVTEGTSPAPEGLGYSRIPGLFSAAQVAGWRAVTDAVHARGGHIVAQLMHAGRIGHPDNLPAGARLLAPSAVRPETTLMWTDQAMDRVPIPAPEAMTEAEVREARDSFVLASRNAIDAGFDGVELHGANGYLLEQFLNPTTNHRDDAWGGTLEKRARFVVETATACAEAIGADRVGLRVSPYNTYNDMGAHDAVDATYRHVAKALRGLLYLHVIQHGDAAYPATEAAIRELFGGPVILNAGFDRARAEAALTAGRADFISFGRPFVSNPDLVARLQRGAELAAPDPMTFFSADAKGYTDYPAL
ncbi:MAG: alkene reductase [Deltaproteobacteria bacterium]|nr:alkene reductase [Deltaproteobacteria bacterium]